MTEFVLQYLTQSTIVSVLACGLVVLVAMVFRRKPGVVHLACILALLAMLTPRLWFMPVPDFGQAAFFDNRSDSTRDLRPPFDRDSADEIRNFIEHDRSETLSHTGLPTSPGRAADGSTSEVDQQESGDNQSTSGAGLASASVVNSPASQAGDNHVSARWPLAQVLLAIWGIGGFIYAAWNVHAITGFHRTIRRAKPASGKLARLARKCSKDMGLARPIEVFELDQSISPLVYSVFGRPKLLMPTRLISGLSAGELEALVRHEMAHIKRRDHWVRILELAATTVFWFNPLVWMIRHTLRRAEELACDSIVAGTSAIERESYASAFLKTIEFLSTGQRVCTMPIACTIGGFRFCKRRLTAIITGSHQASISLPQRLSLLAATLPLLVFGFSSTSAPSLADATAEAASTSPSDPEGTQDAENRNATAPPSTSADAPKVVSVFPADGAGNVPCEATIKIRFDQPMSFDKITLEWEIDQEAPTGFRLRGEPSYDAARNEFFIPVFLEPGKKHSLVVNKKDYPESENHRFGKAGFSSESGLAAKSFSWSFNTADVPQANAGPIPKIVDVSPASGTEVALSTTLRVQFDQPMDPDWFGFEPRTGYWRADFRVSGDIAYDPETFEFFIPLTFPPNWNGDVSPAGFRSAKGVMAEPGTFLYRTRSKPISDEQIAAISAAGRNAGLVQTLEKIQRRYESIKSVKVDVLSTNATWWHDKLWARSVEVTRTSFARDGEKYFGDVSVIMKLKGGFLIGSDGNKCWWRYGNDLVVGPMDQIDIKEVSIASPFNGFSGRTIQQIIEEEKLEYLGVHTAGGKSFHRIRSWASVNENSNFPSAEPIIWSFDTETLLLAKVRHHYEMKFVYQSLDAPLPESLFAPPDSAGLTIQEIEPLRDGYNKRFLRISDGSKGRMSLRWGQYGEGGTYGSGFN